MKKLFVLLVLILLPAALPAQEKAKALPQAQLKMLVSDYSGVDGFETVRVGRLGMGFVKSLIRTSLKHEKDEDVQVVLKMINGIKSVAIVDFSDSAAGDRNRFVRRLDRMLDGVEMLAEVKDDGQDMRIFGVVDEKGESVRDIVVYSPSDNMLFCLYGSMSTRQLAKLMK